MILLLAVALGLIAGIIRTRIRRREFHLPELQLLWLVPIAYLPQFLSFDWPAPRKIIPDCWAAVALVSSQILLLVFVWANRRRPEFWILGLGLTLNLLVIILNGGLMPISPDMVKRLFPNELSDFWELNQRLGGSKDVVLEISATKLRWLSDCIFLSILGASTSNGAKGLPEKIIA